MSDAFLSPATIISVMAAAVSVSCAVISVRIELDRRNEEKARQREQRERERLPVDQARILEQLIQVDRHDLESVKKTAQFFFVAAMGGSFVMDLNQQDVNIAVDDYVIRSLVAEGYLNWTPGRDRNTGSFTLTGKARTYKSSNEE